MSSANIKTQSPIGLKMTVGYLAFFIFNSLLLFAGFYYLFSTALKQKDHEILENKIAEYALIYNQEGLESFKKHLTLLRMNPLAGQFFVQIEDDQHHVLMSFLPEHLDSFNAKDFTTNFAKHDKNLHWDYVGSADHEDDIEIRNEALSHGAILSLGQSVDDREDTIERFRKQFFIVLGLTLILGVVGGVAITGRLLKPLRDLINTIQRIHTGDENLRVPVPATKDELGQLSSLFNKMLDRLQQSNQSMRQTLDTVAHELRTPLTSIRGQSELFLQKKETSPEVRILLEETIEGIDDVLTEFKAMTDITEVEVGLQNLKKEPTPLARICEQVVDLYEVVAEQKQIRLQLQCPSDIMVLADGKKIRQALANLVDNAIKYSQEGGLVQIRGSVDEHCAIIEVQDQGIGIPQNEVSQIFKRLYRGSNGRHEKGLGLGLSLVRSIVQAHDGRIEVTSSPQAGSTFKITIPKS